MVASTIIELHSFIKRKRKYTCANCKPANVSDITLGTADIEINELKSNLNEIEGINTVLREEKQHLREENTIL